MEISRLDAWYSSEDGSLESPAMYIVRGLCRRVCLPEVILRSMQVSFFIGEFPCLSFVFRLLNIIEQKFLFPLFVCSDLSYFHVLALTMLS